MRPVKNPFNYLQFAKGDAQKKLLEDGILETDDGRCHVADPLFAEYLRVQ